MKKRDQIVKEVQKRILASAPEARIILYGSRARGDAREDSDWDFLILLEQLSPLLENELLRTIYDLEEIKKYLIQDD